MNQEITFLSDGNDMFRALQMGRSPAVTHLLDWVHILMTLPVLGQYGKGLVHCEVMLEEEIWDQIARLKWLVWHSQIDKALGKMDDLATSIEPFDKRYARFPRLVKALSELRMSMVNNRRLKPTYGERYQNGEAIATGFVESTMNEGVSKRFCQK